MTFAKRNMLVSVWIAVVVVLLGLLHARLAPWNDTKQRSTELMYLPDERFLQLASLGNRQLVADLLWIRSIQVMGERNVSLSAGRWLYRVFDLITSIDPKFIRVYEAGSIALCTLVTMPEESNRLLEKGIAHNPAEWKLWFLLGVNLFYELSDDAKAAEAFSRAAQIPGAPDNLAQLAAKLYAIGGSPQQAVNVLTMVHERTTDASVRNLLEWRIKAMIVERDLQILEHALRLYKTRFSQPAARLEDLVQPGLLSALPIEPFGGQYVYDVYTGVVRSTEITERPRITVRRRGQ